MTINFSELVAGLNFGEAGTDTDAMRYLKTDLMRMNTRWEIDKVLSRTVDENTYAAFHRAAAALNEVVCMLATPHVRQPDDPAAWYVKAAEEEWSLPGTAKMAIAPIRESAVEIARMVSEVEFYLPGSADTGGEYDSRPINDFAELRVNPFWELGFPFVNIIGGYVNSGQPGAALRFVQGMSGDEEFLAWIHRFLVVINRLATSTVQCIDEALDRLGEG